MIKGESCVDFILETKKVNVCDSYDVIVVGGGISGVAAALAAARNGSKVLLVEKTTVLGGLATSGLVIIYLPLCDGMGHKVMGGIPEELLHASIKYGYNTLPDEWRSRPWEADTKKRYRTIFNAPAFVMALDELVKEAKIDVLFDTVFCDVVMKDGCCSAVFVENKSGRQAYRCKAVVDASGDADVLYRAGAECIEQDNHLTYWAYCQSDNEKNILASGGVPPKFMKVMAIGNYCGSDLPPGLPKYRGTNAREVTDFLIKSREMALRRIKEDPSLVFSSFPSQAQFRTTRRLKGDHTLCTADAGRHFADSIGCTGIWNVPAPVYEIPFGSITTKLIKNIFAAGRIISAANGQGWEITRPIPACAVTGQAAGSAAAIFACTGGEPSPLGLGGTSGNNVPIGKLQAMLKKDGVMLTMSEKLVKQSGLWLDDWRKSEDQWYKDKEEGLIYQVQICD